MTKSLEPQLSIMKYAKVFGLMLIGQWLMMPLEYLCRRDSSIKMETSWIPIKEIGSFILWSNSGQGSMLKFTYTPLGVKITPEMNDTFFYSRKACENAIENDLRSMIKRQLGSLTLLTQRQQQILMKSYNKRFEMKEK